MSGAIASHESNSVLQDEGSKRYKVKSGKIEYSVQTSGKVMGSTVKGSGTQKLFFKDWGVVEVREEKSEQTTTVSLFGQSSVETETVHTLVKLDHGQTSMVDYETKQITQGRDMMSGMAASNGTNMSDMGEEMMISMGGKKTGTEKVLGYTCDIWELAGTKQWVYKGVSLKMEADVMGVKTTTTATSARFDCSVADEHFELPDFPVQQSMNPFDMGGDFEDDEDNYGSDEEIEQDMEKLSKMSYEEWKKMALADDEDEELQNMSETELRQMYDMMQKVIKARLGE